MMKQPDETVRIAIYSRKSRYTGQGESIENQIELCREYIRVHYGGKAAAHAEVYEDEGFSGGNLRRPGFKKLMEEARKRRYSAVVVYRLDRISRNVSDFSALIEELSRMGVAFVSIREQFDTGTPMGRAMMYIASVFSQLERETIAERIRDNMHELAKTGRWLGGNTPLGYASESVTRVEIDGRAKKAVKLKCIREEAETVKTIFALFLETGSLASTEAELMRRGLTTRSGKCFSRFAVRHILQNPVYLIADSEAYVYLVRHGCDLFSDREAFDGVRGILAYNKTERGKTSALVYLPPEEWIVSVGRHEGLISGKMWTDVQEMLRLNQDKSYHRPRINRALLTGILYCSCGSRMYPRLTGRKTPDGEAVFCYSCLMKERSRRSRCAAKNANGNLLDALVAGQIRQLAEDRDAFVCGLEKSRVCFGGGGGSGDRLQPFRKEKAELEKKMDTLLHSLENAEKDGSEGYIRKRMNELADRICAAEAEIRKREEEEAAREMEAAEFERLRRSLADFGECFDCMGIEQKRAAIRRLAGRVVWDGKCAHLYLAGAEEPSDVPRAETRE